MNALIFLVPEDIVDVRPRLVRRMCCLRVVSAHVDSFVLTDFDVYRKLDEHRSLGSTALVEK